MPFEKLNSAFVLPGSRATLERAEVPSFAGLGIFLSRI
jgi:hypothetical protein